MIHLCIFVQLFYKLCTFFLGPLRHNSSTSVGSESSSISDGDDWSNSRRNRTIFTKKQADQLENIFRTTHYPDLKARHEISKKTKLTENRIQVQYKLA